MQCCIDLECQVCLSHSIVLIWNVTFCFSLSMAMSPSIEIMVSYIKFYPNNRGQIGDKLET